MRRTTGHQTSSPVLHVDTQHEPAHANPTQNISSILQAAPSLTLSKGTRCFKAHLSLAELVGGDNGQREDGRIPAQFHFVTESHLEELKHCLLTVGKMWCVSVSSL